MTQSHYRRGAIFQAREAYHMIARVRLRATMIPPCKRPCGAPARTAPAPARELFVAHAELVTSARGNIVPIS